MGRVYSSKALMKLLEADGWYLVAAEGDHYQYKHPRKKGRVTLTHPVKNLPKGTANSILKQAGLKDRK